MIDMILYDIAEDASANGLCVCVSMWVFGTVPAC